MHAIVMKIDDEHTQLRVSSQVQYGSEFGKWPILVPNHDIGLKTLDLFLNGSHISRRNSYHAEVHLTGQKPLDSSRQDKFTTNYKNPFQLILKESGVPRPTI